MHEDIIMLITTLGILAIPPAAIGYIGLCSPPPGMAFVAGMAMAYCIQHLAHAATQRFGDSD